MSKLDEAMAEAQEKGTLLQVALRLQVSGVEKLNATLDLMTPGDRLLFAPAAADLVTAMKCLMRLTETQAVAHRPTAAPEDLTD